jgi:hypothetical protein
MREVVAEFESHCSDAPSSYGDNGCRLSGLDHSAMVLRHERYTNNSYDSIYLFARKQEHGAQVFIYVFPNTALKTEWKDRLTLYEEQRRNFRMPLGQKFNKSYLAPAASEFCQHTAFRTRDGRTRWRVVHTFEGKNRNVLLVYSHNTNDFINSEFFSVVSKGLSVSDLPLTEPFRQYRNISVAE